MEAAVVSTTSFQRVHDRPLAPPLTVPVPVPQPYSRSRADTYANAHALSHTNHPHVSANTQIHDLTDANAHVDGNSRSSSAEAAWHFHGGIMHEYDEPEEHESDVSRPHDDQSARASSVTTPDILVPRALPQQRFNSKQGQMVDSNLRLSSLNYHDDRQIKPPLLSSLLPPPPPPPDDAAVLAPRRTSSRRPQKPYIDTPPPPPPRKNDVGGSYIGLPPLPPPPPPPATGSDNVTPRGSEVMYPTNRPPPPPPSEPHSPTESSDQTRGYLHQHLGWDPKSHVTPSGIKISRATDFSTSDGKSYNSTRERARQKSFRRSESHSSGSSTYSKTRPSAGQPSDSGSTSEEDPTVFRNARQFPPLLPTHPTFGSPGTDSKASVQNRITAWVAHYEGSRSLRIESPGDIRGGVSSNGSESRSDDGTARSDVSEASSVEEIEMLWTQLKEKRAKLVDMKFEMAKRRKDMRDLRRRKDDADNAFMSVVRPMFVNQIGHNHTGGALIERRLSDMQSIRTDYHFTEAQYEGLEVMLDEEEAELHSLETRFFSLLAAGRTRAKRPRSDTDSEVEKADHFRSMPLDLKGIAPDGPPEDRHPLYTELLSTVGDLENAKEEHEDLLFFKEQYDYNVSINDAAGRLGDEDEIEFLAEFPSRKQQLKNCIIELQEAVVRLRNLCETKGVLPRHTSAQVEYLLYPEREYEDMDLDDIDMILERRPNLAHHQFPVLVTQPEYVLAEDVPHTPYGALRAAASLPNDNPDKRTKVQLAAKEYAIDRLLVDKGANGKADSVNRWLLQQLRMSPMNAVILYLTFVSKNSLKIRDFWRWQSDVLHYWWRDDAASPGEDLFKLLTSRGSQYASGVCTSPLSRAVSEGFGVSEARQRTTHSSDVRTAAA